MPYSVALSFSYFYDNINLPGNHRDTANRRRDDIVSSLKKKFDVMESFSSGSIPRYTALKGHADLDIIVALHYSNHIKDKKPSEVLQDVRDVLAEFKTNVRKNGQAVTLHYKTWPNVDIVPCCRVIDDNGKVISYSIPDMNTENWITSKPKLHTSKMTLKSSECGQNFRRVITMIKYWNRKHGKYLQSYHIEVLAINIYTGAMGDTAWDIYTFFNKALELVSNNLWYEGAYVDSYLTWNSRQEALKRLETAKDKSLTAWSKTYDDSNDDEAAITIWRQIFGDKFPAYG